MPPDSSPEDEIVVEAKVDATEVTTLDDTDPAASSSAEAKDEKPDLLETVKAALKDTGTTEKTSDSKEPDSKSEEDPDAAAKKEGAEAEADPDALTEDELSRLRPKTRKRIDNLLRDRVDRDRKIEELLPKAEQFEKIAGFVETAGLSKDEVNDGFAVMADLKNAPLKAYERLKPIMAQLAIMAGEGPLPTDLQQEVNFGRITEDHARELVKSRSLNTLTSSQIEQQQRRDQERKQRDDHIATVNEVSNAVSDWERSKEKADPSWKLKQPRITEIVELEITRRQRANPNYFPTKKEALEFSEAALKKVETEFKNMAPKPREVRPVTPGAGSTRSSAAPTSMLEAAKAGLAKAAG